MITWDIDKRICNKCREQKPSTSFYQYCKVCKECRKSYQRVYYQLNYQLKIQKLADKISKTDPRSGLWYPRKKAHLTEYITPNTHTGSITNESSTPRTRKVCPNCGVSFIPKTSTNAFCGIGCIKTYFRLQ